MFRGRQREVSEIKKAPLRLKHGPCKAINHRGTIKKNQSAMEIPPIQFTTSKSSLYCFKLHDWGYRVKFR